MSCQAFQTVVAGLGMNASQFATTSPCCNATVQSTPVVPPFVSCHANNTLKELALVTKESKPVPTSLSQFTGLEYLFLGGKWTGVVPKEYANLTRLSGFALQGTALSGSLPAEYAVWNLTRLNLIGNRELKGSIPEALGSWMELDDVSIAENGLQGALPSSWKNMVHPRHCYMDQATCKALTNKPTTCESFCGWTSGATRESALWMLFAVVLF
jgi:hypothetical protein